MNEITSEHGHHNCLKTYSGALYDVKDGIWTILFRFYHCRICGCDMTPDREQIPKP